MKGAWGSPSPKHTSQLCLLQEGLAFSSLLGVGVYERRPLTSEQRYAEQSPSIYKMNSPSLDLIEQIFTKGFTTCQALC